MARTSPLVLALTAACLSSASAATYSAGGHIVNVCSAGADSLTVEVTNKNSGAVTATSTAFSWPGLPAPCIGSSDIIPAATRRSSPRAHSSYLNRVLRGNDQRAVVGHRRCWQEVCVRGARNQRAPGSCVQLHQHRRRPCQP